MNKELILILQCLREFQQETVYCISLYNIEGSCIRDRVCKNCVLDNSKDEYIYVNQIFKVKL